MRLSIIVPMLDEAAELPDLCAHLLPLFRAGVEIIFVDGGSRDGSPAIAQAAGFRVLNSLPGRARQMNAGAAASSGDALLFLHADTRLPEGRSSPSIGRCANTAGGGSMCALLANRGRCGWSRQ